MNGKDFLNELEHLDDDLVQKHEMPKKRKPVWRKYVGIAACAVICAGLFGAIGWMGWMDHSSMNLVTSGEASCGSAQAASAEITLLAAAKLPEIPEQPNESELYGMDGEVTQEQENAYWEQSEAYYDALDALKKERPDSAYLAGLRGFSVRTTAQILRSEDEKDENIVYSPANLYMALTMLTECADGNTRRQLLDLLGTDDVKQMREQTDLIWKALYSDSAYGKTTLANSLWLNNNISDFQEDTLELLAEKYYASSYSVPMGNRNTDQAIADWIDENTGDLLSDQSGRIQTRESDAARLYSTLYFYGQWTDRFAESQTSQDTFTCADGTEVVVDFMHQTTSDGFVRGDGYTMAWRSFQDGQSMVFVLPEEGTEISSLWDKEELQEQLMDSEAREKNAVWGDVVWSMPKFDIASTKGLTGSLKALGVTDVFGEDADLSNLAEGLYVEDILQSARVKVDEKGCEAASYTEIQISEAAEIGAQGTCEMNLNRPFLFAVTGEDNLPLFLGVVNQVEE